MHSLVKHTMTVVSTTTIQSFLLEVNIRVGPLSTASQYSVEFEGRIFKYVDIGTVPLLSYGKILPARMNL